MAQRKSPRRAQKSRAPGFGCAAGVSNRRSAVDQSKGCGQEFAAVVKDRRLFAPPAGKKGTAGWWPLRQLAQGLFGLLRETMVKNMTSGEGKNRLDSGRGLVGKNLLPASNLEVLSVPKIILSLHYRKHVAFLSSRSVGAKINTCGAHFEH